MWEDSVFYYEKDFQEKFDELMEVAFKLKSRIIWEIGDDADLNDNKRGRLLAQLEEVYAECKYTEMANI